MVLFSGKNGSGGNARIYDGLSKFHRLQGRSGVFASTNFVVFSFCYFGLSTKRLEDFLCEQADGGNNTFAGAGFDFFGGFLHSLHQPWEPVNLMKNHLFPVFATQEVLISATRVCNLSLLAAAGLQPCLKYGKMNHLCTFLSAISHLHKLLLSLSPA
ncbi:hypothetical protein NE237_018249 [Protea cynaroides]|uniref:Uncharacterized protein n=1 Tax=Protea cynaroides TaxID=273540 RepID=A0A9Q0QNR5_9MAGN|nr:hypothetical protein NE237_018249 [Protea cynaroides]